MVTKGTLLGVTDCVYYYQRSKRQLPASTSFTFFTTSLQWERTILRGLNPSSTDDVYLTCCHGNGIGSEPGARRTDARRPAVRGPTGYPTSFKEHGKRGV